MVDVTEILIHWYAGRSLNEVAGSLGVDRKTIRKYLAPAVAAGLAPGGPAMAQADWATDAAQTCLAEAPLDNDSRDLDRVDWQIVAASVHRRSGRLDEALAVAQAAIDLAAGMGPVHSTPAALSALGSVNLARNEYGTAIENFTRARGLAAQMGHRFSYTEASIGLGTSHARHGDLTAATTLALEALTLAVDGYELLQGSALTLLAEIHLSGRRPEEATRHAQHANEIQTRIGHRAGCDQSQRLIALATEAQASGALGLTNAGDDPELARISGRGDG